METIINFAKQTWIKFAAFISEMWNPADLHDTEDIITSRILAFLLTILACLTVGLTIVFIVLLVLNPVVLFWTCLLCGIPVLIINLALKTVKRTP